MRKKFFCAVLLGLFFFANGDELVKAFSLSNYPRCRQLAKKRKDEPLGKLIMLLVKVYDKTNTENITLQGLYELGDYYRDEKMPSRYRMLAGMSYARCGQLAQDRRDIYGNVADNIDYASVYKDIIKKYPNTQEACAAVLYLKSSPEEINAFIAKYRGNKKYLVPLYLFQAYLYTESEKKDYNKAIGALESASKIGIANPSLRQSTLFRIGFLYDRKLKNFKLAEKYYREYLKLYPLSRNSRIILRYLAEKGK